MENKEFFPRVEGAEMDDQELEEVNGGIAAQTHRSVVLTKENGLSATEKEAQVLSGRGAVNNAMEYSTEAEERWIGAQTEKYRGPFAKFLSLFAVRDFIHTLGFKKQ